MGLSSVGINAAINWQLARSVGPFADVTQGPDGANFALNALPVATWNELFAAQYTISASGTQAVDLRSFTDLPGNAVTATAVLAVLVLVTGDAADVLNVKAHGTDGLQWFFENATHGVNVPGGGMFLFSEGSDSAGTAVDATHRQLLLTNTGGADLTVTLVALVSTL